jgi:hypothetical protein
VVDKYTKGGLKHTKGGLKHTKGGLKYTKGGLKVLHITENQIFMTPSNRTKVYKYTN